MTVNRIAEYVDNMFTWANSMADMAVTNGDYGLMKYWKGQAYAYQALKEMIERDQE